MQATQVTKVEKKQGNKDLQKTRLCVYNLEGKCGYGSNCSFAHSSNEIRGVPNLAKTQLCTKFAEGKCSDENCTYAHGQEDLRDSPNFKKKICKWNQKGQCRNGAKCGFAHSSLEVRAAPAVEPPPGFEKVIAPPPGLEKIGPEEESTAAPSSSDVSLEACVPLPEAHLFHLAAARGAAPVKQQVAIMSSAIGALQAKLAALEDMVMQSQVTAMQQSIQQLSEQCWALEAGLSMAEPAPVISIASYTPLSKLNSKAAPFVPFVPSKAFNELAEDDDGSTSVGSSSNQ